MVTPSFATYRNPERPKYPFCPGCGHGRILDHLDAALVRLQLDPHRVVLVTDIGCVGMADQYFAVHAFHGLHGRSVAYATGIKLVRPDLKVIVLIGDGGCGIGGHHLLNAARRNIGVAVLVFNNLNFGMTGGEHSVTSPYGARTADTRLGNLERPLDLCATVAANGASYVYRGASFDQDLDLRIADAIMTEGFALLDIWEMCTAHYVPNNEFSRAALSRLQSELGLPTGLVVPRDAYPEFARAVRSQAAAVLGQPVFPARPVAAQFTCPLNSSVRWVLAGAAGEKVRSAANLFARAGMLCGLWASQRDDYPTTVMSGHSVSEVILSPHEIQYTGAPSPDLIIVLTPEGLAQVQAQLLAMTPAGRVYVVPALADHVETRAHKYVLGGDLARVHRKALALATLAAVLRHTGLLPIEALREAVRTGGRVDLAAQSLAALGQNVVVQ